jgi:hypothetical protein
VKRTIATASVLVGAFLAIYVVYAHVASWRMAARTPTAWSTRLQQPDLRAEGFTVAREGLDATMVGGALTVGGATGRPGFFRAGQRSVRFDSARLQVQFQTGERAAYDVLVGFQRADDPSRRIAFAFANDGSAPRLRLIGVDAPTGPPHEGDGILDEIDADTAAVLGPGQRHELAIRFDGTRHRIELFVDDTPVRTHTTGWMAGIDVVPFFGVEERVAGTNPHVTFDTVVFAPVPSGPPLRGFNVLDVFPGNVPDPLFWHTNLPALYVGATGGLGRVESGSGLRLRGRATSAVPHGEIVPLEVCTNPVELAPMFMETVWTVHTLAFATLYTRIENTEGSRSMAAGVHATASGDDHWLFFGMADGGLDERVEQGAAVEPAPDGTVAFRVSYEPWLGTAVVYGNGKEVHRRRYDLRRAEFVRLCVGARVATGGEFDATLHSFKLHVAPY